MATYTTENYTNGAKVRVTSDNPQWRSFTHKLPAGTAYASADVINLATFGDDYQIVAFRVSTNASIAADTGSCLLKLTSDSDGSAAADTLYTIGAGSEDLGGAGAVFGDYVVTDHRSTDGAVLSLTLGILGTPVSTGERSITVSVLVSPIASNAGVEGANLVTYESPYTL